jgi:hypothetical protein
MENLTCRAEEAYDRSSKKAQRSGNPEAVLFLLHMFVTRSLRKYASE